MWTYKGIFEKGYRAKEARKPQKKAIKRYTIPKERPQPTFFEGLVSYGSMFLEAKNNVGLGSYCVSLLFGYIEYGKPATVRKIDKLLTGKTRGSYKSVYTSLETLVNRGYLAKYAEKKRVVFGFPVVTYRVTLKGHDAANELRKIQESKLAIG